MTQPTKCGRCGARKYRTCETCGMWINDCTNKKGHKDKGWQCLKGCTSPLPQSYGKNGVDFELPRGEQ